MTPETKQKISDMASEHAMLGLTLAFTSCLIHSLAGFFVHVFSSLAAMAISVNFDQTDYDDPREETDFVKGSEDESSELCEADADN